STVARITIVITTPMNIVPSAAPSDEVDPWIWDPTQSHSNGVPIHRTRLPMNMIRTTSMAPTPVRSNIRTRSGYPDASRCQYYRRAERNHGETAICGPVCQGRGAAPRPLANGQPEESLTCHQPISMPLRPSCGLTSQPPPPG